MTLSINDAVLHQLLPEFPFPICDYDGVTYFAKIHASSDSLTLLLTDLQHCWLCELQSKDIDVLRQRSSLSFIVSPNDVFPNTTCLLDKHSGS
ncbi:hypothetical protein GEMRC1_012866 [Eukaryota sp. GEM-RC1]